MKMREVKLLQRLSKNFIKRSIYINLISHLIAFIRKWKGALKGFSLLFIVAKLNMIQYDFIQSTFFPPEA